MKDTERTFTLDEVKRAFWKEFHEAGELWFEYMDSPEENSRATESAWQEFKESLFEGDNIS